MRITPHDPVGVTLRSSDEIQAGTAALRIQFLGADPLSSLDVLMTIDMPAWAALVALIAECPVIHGGPMASVDLGVRSVDPNAFEFISGPDQLRLIRSFMRALPAILSISK